MPTRASINQAKYDKENTKFYGIKLNKKFDAELIEKLSSVPSINGYIKQLIRDDIARTCSVSAPKTEKKEGSKMRNISIDNGNSFVSVPEAIAKVSWETIVAFMDDDIRETVHNEIAPCTEEEFLTRYLELAHDDLIIG